jgi:predicted deacylase
VDYVYLSKVQPEMSMAFGSSLLYSGGGFRGTFSGTAEEKNVPTVVVEIGGGGLLDKAYIERGVQGAFNVMKYLKMIDGTPEVPAHQTVFKQLTYLHPKTAGALYPELPLDQLGKIVAGGTVLGRVVSPYTFEELEVLTAPFERNFMILSRGFIARVNPGDFAYMCANADVA